MTFGIPRATSLSPSPLLLILAALPLLPTWCYVNRGFTQWFHWMSIVYLLTGSKFLEKVQIITGIAICVGWYSALGYAAVYYGQFCQILYQNMPSSIKDHIFDESTGEIQYGSTKAQQMMVLSHALDFVGHPLLTYFFWHRHKRRQSQIKADSKRSTVGGGVFSHWPVILTSYAFSRLWSIFHTSYNHGRPRFFYVGHDIYIMDHLDCWIPAYIAESAFFVILILGKLFTQDSSAVEGDIHSNELISESYVAMKKTEGTSSIVDKPPKLSYSRSGVSRSSSYSKF